MRRAHASVGAFQSNVRGMSNVRKRCLELVREIDQVLDAPAPPPPSISAGISAADNKRQRCLELVREIDQVLDSVQRSLDREQEEQDRILRVVARWSRLASSLTSRWFERNSPTVSEIIIACELSALLDA